VFNRILLSASIAGVLAAMALTVAQTLWSTPLILQAEEFEDAAQTDSVEHHASPASAAEHHHGHAWQPENGWQRTLSTAASNSVMGIGFALILCGIYTLRPPASFIRGLCWGLAGYVVFFAAPASGLPPELPGTATAELAARQYWWIGTSVATAAGLGLIFLQPRNSLKVTGAVLLAIPHLVGAPHPAVPASLTPETLQTSFRFATLFLNALFWLLLGMLSAVAFRHFAGQQRNQPG
jgi:cobalt transporter subunit CbtA